MYPSAGQIPGALDIVGLPSVRGRQYSAEGGFLSAARLATDAIGTTTCTFQGVIAGSEIRVFSSTEIELAGVETCGANHTLTWNAYAPGSSENEVRIKIVNLAYKIKDFPYTTSVGTQQIPIQQEPDPWYRNP